MAVTQYVGARYVPVFADPVEWDITRTYQHLMMVQHQGETFISRQAVPAGISLPDTAQEEESNDYWVHMSNWNAQVEQYREEVLAFDGRITTNATDIDALEERLPKSSFTSTNTVKKYIDDSIADLQAKALKNNVLVIGDSFSVCSTDPNNPNHVTTTGAKLWDLVNKRLGVNIINKAVGGAGFLAGTTFSSQLGTANADTSINVDTLKMVIVFGGTNDYVTALNDIESWQDNIRSFIAAYLASKFKKVPCIIIFNKSFGTPGVNYEHVINSGILACMTAAGNVNGRVNAVNASWLMRGVITEGDDGIHPNLRGYYIMSDYMCGIISGLPTQNEYAVQTTRYTLPHDLYVTNEHYFVKDGLLYVDFLLNIPATSTGIAWSDINKVVTIPNTGNIDILSQNCTPTSSAVDQILRQTGTNGVQVNVLSQKDPDTKTTTFSVQIVGLTSQTVSSLCMLRCSFVCHF